MSGRVPRIWWPGRSKETAGWDARRFRAQCAAEVNDGRLAETQFDLRFRLLGVPVRIHPFFWAGFRGHGMARERPSGGVALGGLCFRLDSRPRVWARVELEGVRLLALGRSMGDGWPLLQPGRAANAAPAAGGALRRAGCRVSAVAAGRAAGFWVFLGSRRSSRRNRSRTSSDLSQTPGDRFDKFVNAFD